MILQLTLSCVLLISWSQADLYLHNPRGSNNRLNEKSATRKTNNRLFDSQNNNRGGYNVGDKGASPANNQQEQYMMKYFQSSRPTDGGESILEIEWTNQHGCGGNDKTNPQKQNCDLILQYMCQDDTDTITDDTLRNGQLTNPQKFSEPRKEDDAETETAKRKDNDVDDTEGLHEPWDNYNKCYFRERNGGLFTADKNLNKNKLGYSSAIFTRQNNNGNQNGYECPEERDYFPYWHPTPWKDIAILTDDTSRCRNHKRNSFNTRNYNECVEKYNGDDETTKPYSRWNNQVDCENNGGTWTTFSNYLEKNQVDKKEDCLDMGYKWAVPYDGDEEECLVPLDEPDCGQAPWSRSNHLGNGVQVDDGAEMNRYTWRLPHFPSGDTKRCVLRMRYNISTDDYDPYKTNSTLNKEDSLISNDPVVDIGADDGLRLNINTAQYGRTFQDRTHVFLLRPRTENIKSATIYNLNVRGKRGNIVQTFPAVEYDFVPNLLKIRQDDLVHIQWTGSNTHNNGPKGGDGVTGNAGQGTAGTDRHNFVQVNDLSKNYPSTSETMTMWTTAESVWAPNEADFTGSNDLALYLASGGYFTKADDVGNKADLNPTLNNADASFEGVVLKLTKGTYNYMCTRNNAFSNRSQKGRIIVK